jgi:hypothetical protein
LMLNSEAWTEITPSEFVDVMDDDVKTFDQRMVSTSNCVSSCLNLNWSTISLYRSITVRALRQSNDKDHNYLVCLSSSLRRLRYALIASKESLHVPMRRVGQYNCLNGAAPRKSRVRRTCWFWHRLTNRVRAPRTTVLTRADCARIIR